MDDNRWNVYVLWQDAILTQPSTVQAARAANVVYCIFMYRRGLDREDASPVSIILLMMCKTLIETVQQNYTVRCKKTVPLCL